MIPYINVIREENNYHLKIPKNFNYNGTAIDAAIFTVNHIIDNYPPPYTLCLTGGVDSQAMLYSWILSGKKFNTFSAVYNQNLNFHDLENLIQFSVNYNIPINFYNFDLINFLFNEHEKYALTYRCGSPHMCVFMKFIEIINQGTVIFSGQFQRHEYKHEFVDKNNFSIYRYAETTSRSVVPWFFLETAEIFSSFANLNDNRIGDHLIEYEKKYKTYQLNGFPVLPQPQKLTGFENIKDYFDLHYSHLLTPIDKIARTSLQGSKRTFDRLFRNKYEAKFREDKYIIETVNNKL